MSTRCKWSSVYRPASTVSNGCPEGSQTLRYWITCLPPFPIFLWLLLFDQVLSNTFFFDSTLGTSVLENVICLRFDMEEGRKYAQDSGDSTERGKSEHANTHPVLRMLPLQNMESSFWETSYPRRMKCPRIATKDHWLFGLTGLHGESPHKLSIRILCRFLLWNLRFLNLKWEYWIKIAWYLVYYFCWLRQSLVVN